jgi:hypothetical protein
LLLAKSFDHVSCVEAAFHFRIRESFLHKSFDGLARGSRLVVSEILLCPPG